MIYEQLVLFISLLHKALLIFYEINGINTVFVRRLLDSTFIVFDSLNLDKHELV